MSAIITSKKIVHNISELQKIQVRHKDVRLHDNYRLIYIDLTYLIRKLGREIKDKQYDKNLSFKLWELYNNVRERNFSSDILSMAIEIANQIAHDPKEKDEFTRNTRDD